MADTDTQEMLNAIMATGKSNRANEEAIQATKQTEFTLRNLNAEDIVSVGAKYAADAQVAAADASFKLETTSANARAKAYLGIDLNAANFRLEKLAQERDEAYANMKAAENKVHAAQSKTLLNDPIGFLLGQFTLPADIADNNHWDRVYNNATTEYDGIVASGTKTGQANAALEATMSTAKAQALQEGISATAAMETNKFKVVGAQLNMSTATAIAKLTSEQLANASNAVHLRDAQTRIEMQRANMEASRLQRDMMLEARLKGNADDASIVDAYNTAARARGFPELSATVILSRAKRAGEDGDLTRDLIGHGENIAANGGNRDGVIFGANPGQSAYMYIKGGATPIGTDADTVKTIATRYNDVMKSNPEISAIKNLAERNQAIGNIIKVDAEKDLRVVTDKSVYYGLQPTEMIVKFIPELGQSKFITESLLPQSANTTPANVRAAAIAAITKDPKRLEEITVDLQRYFSAQKLYNNVMKSHQEIGLPIQTDMIIGVPAGVFGGIVPVNYSNPVEIKTDLMKGMRGNIGTNLMKAAARSIGPLTGHGGDTIGLGGMLDSAKANNESYTKGMIGSTSPYNQGTK